MGFPANEMLRGGEVCACCSDCFYPFKQTYFVISCRFTQTHTQTHHGLGLYRSQMIPESEEASSTKIEKDDGVLAGYKECATEALNWLLNLGYEPGHPLIRSLAAHLTKKQAYLEKINLERFLIDETFKNSVAEMDEDGEIDPSVMTSRYNSCIYLVQNDKEIQKALIDVVFKGCDLQYCKDVPQ